MSRPYKDWTGATIGGLTILKRDEPNGSGERLWVAECECGRIGGVRISDKIRQKFASCGRCGLARRQARRSNPGKTTKDFSGQRVGALVFVERGGRAPTGQRLWKARCDCGRIVELNPWNKIRQQEASCGHCGIARTEAARKRMGKSKGDLWNPAAHYDESQEYDLWRLAICKIWKKEPVDVESIHGNIASCA